MHLTFRWVREDRPGPKWAALAARSMPSYLDWYRGEGEARRPKLDVCRRELARHMPELVPVWEALVGLAGGDPTIARMLSLWRPPAYFAGCSQAVWTRGSPLLARNYDYFPSATEGVFLSTAWTGTSVLAASDCLWGVLDGVNEHGLAVALAYGGRTVRGPGFGIPLVLRYVLETCGSAPEAIEVLRRVPSHMAYNVSVVDERSRHAVVQVGPDQEARVLRSAVATNHQRVLRWPLDERAARSLRRERHLQALLADRGLRAGEFCDAFLSQPLYATDHAVGDGTLYTVVYRPVERRADYLWPDQRLSRALADEIDEERVVEYGRPATRTDPN